MKNFIPIKGSILHSLLQPPILKIKFIQIYFPSLLLKEIFPVFLCLMKHFKCFIRHRNHNLQTTLCDYHRMFHRFPNLYFSRLRFIQIFKLFFEILHPLILLHFQLLSILSILILLRFLFLHLSFSILQLL
jgi:hypothetical protein